MTCKVGFWVAGDELRGTSNETPDANSWGFTTRSSWFIPSHPQASVGRIYTKIDFLFIWRMGEPFALRTKRGYIGV